jgi:transcriptional regulator with XRE-family HTH domain
MEKTGLGEYLEAMRRCHPRLSKRKMAIDAGVNESAVQQIIAGRTGASPSTLKSLADAWGTPEDYIRLMELAGHPVAEGRRREPGLDDEEKELMRYYDQLSPEDQRLLVDVARTFAEAEKRREGRPVSKPAATAASGA